MPKPVDAAAYYTTHAGEEKEYVRVYAARSVKAGESIARNVGGLYVESKTEDAGYELSAYHGFRSSDKDFMTVAEFRQNTVSAADLPLAVPREDISPEEQKGMKPVAKGTRITIDVGVPIVTKAPYDGFTVDVGGNLPVFMSNYELTTVFNYAGAKQGTHEDLVVALKGEPTVKGIILDRDVTFDFKDGPYLAKAGSFLYKNAEDKDGYTAAEPGFANLGLRRFLSAEELGAQKNMHTQGPVDAPAAATFRKKP